MRILSIITLLCVCAGCLFTFPAYAGEKVAVLDFKSILAPEDLGVAVAEILRTELVELGDYTVIERGMLAQLMQEQSFQLTGAVDSETAVEIGKLVGAKLVVIGSIVKTGSVYTINSRFIDVETGIAKIGQNIRGQGEDQISNMVHQLALIITGKTIVAEEAILAGDMTPTPNPITAVPTPSQEGRTLLFSFETQEEFQQWQQYSKRSSALSLSAEHATEGTHSLQIVIPKSDGRQEIHATNIPEDWSAYPIFAFDLYYNAKQSDKAWLLIVRIDDRRTNQLKRNWFMQGSIIEPGATTIRVRREDIAKELDVKHIKQVILATNKLEHDIEVYLDNFRFENVLPPAPTQPFCFSFEIEGEEVVNWHSNGRLISLKQSDQHVTQGKYSVQVELPRKFPGNPYPGIFSDAFPKDWSNYKHFSADLYYDQKRKETVTIGVQIDDLASTSYETQFNWEMELKPGSNNIQIPLKTIDQAIDISQVKRVYIFLIEPKERTTLYLDHICVE
jgi:hypothetical protein